MKIEAVKELDELPFSMRATDLSRALNVSRSRVYEIMNIPGFPAVKVGRTKIVTKPALRDWLEAQQST